MEGQKSVNKPDDDLQIYFFNIPGIQIKFFTLKKVFDE